MGPGSGDEVSNYVAYNPWLSSPVTDIKERIARDVDIWNYGATIVKGPIQLPAGKKCVVYDISGREIDPVHAGPGIFFVEVEGQQVYKIIKIR